MSGFNFIRKWVVKQLTKKADEGIMVVLPKKNKVDLNTSITAERLMSNGINPNSIKSVEQVDNIINQLNKPRVIDATSSEGKKITKDLFGKKGEVFDLTGKKIDTSKPILGGKNVPETEAEIAARLTKENKETVERLRNKEGPIDWDEVDKIDPEDFAGGGVAGLLGETDRVPYQHGSRQPGMERSVNKAAREKITRDVQNLQQQMAERGGGDARDYVSQHNLNEAIAKRKEDIKEIIPPGPSDRHPGTEKMPLIKFPRWMVEKWYKERYEPKAWGQDLQYPYEDEEDIPEGILELLRKDPSFDLEEFKKIGWGTPENVWYKSGVGETSPDVGGKGLQGVYFGGYPKGIEMPILPINQVPPGERGKPKLLDRKTKVKVPPSGPPSERVWDPEKLKDPTTFTPSDLYADTINLQHNPFKKDDSPWIANPNIPTSYVGSSRSSNVDKARTALHELRHKKYVENPVLWKSQPEWVQNVEMPGTEEWYQSFDESGRRAYMTGHELYNRFLDQQYFPPLRDTSPSEPYFDKILKDLWEPSAEEYERLLKAQDLGERYAKGGLAHVLGV